MIAVLVFITVFLSFICGSVWYLGQQLIAGLPFSAEVILFLWCLLAGIALLSVGGIFAFQMERHRSGRARILIFVQEVSYLVMGWLSCLLTVVVIIDILHAMLGAFYFLIMQRQSDFLQNIMSEISAVHSLACVVVAFLFTAYGFHRCMNPVVNEVKIALPNLHPDLNGFRIGVISDLHVGPWFREKFVRKVVDLTNAGTPDVIVFVGDVAEGLPRHLVSDYAPLRELRAEHGVLFVTGNHEYYWDVNVWLETLRKLGFITLMKSSQIIQRGQGALAIVGVPDAQAKDFPPAEKPDIVRALNTVPPAEMLRILLVHNPNVAQAAARAGVHLQISGHTHGGQFFPWTWFIHLFTRFSSGLFVVEGMKLFVGRGAGAWGPPLRMGSSPEIPLIVLHSDVLSRE